MVGRRQVVIFVHVGWGESGGEVKCASILMYSVQSSLHNIRQPNSVVQAGTALITELTRKLRGGGFRS